MGLAATVSDTPRGPTGQTVEVPFEDVFRMRQGIAYARFAVHVSGQRIERGQEIHLVEGCLGQVLIPLVGRDLVLRRENGIFTVIDAAPAPARSPGPRKA